MGPGPGLTTDELDGRGRSISTAILYDVVVALRELAPGGEIPVRTYALPAVDSDVRAWCRTRRWMEAAGVSVFLQ